MKVGDRVVYTNRLGVKLEGTFLGSGWVAGETIYAVRLDHLPNNIRYDLQECFKRPTPPEPTELGTPREFLVPYVETPEVFVRCDPNASSPGAHWFSLRRIPDPLNGGYLKRYWTWEELNSAR